MTDHEAENKNSVQVLDQHFDGIVEHDHPLPRWWVWLFIITIAFSAVYYAYYELLGGPSLDESLAVKMTALKEKQEAARGDNPFENLSSLIGDEDAIALGQSLYTNNCAMCHGQKGEGGIGPNLTDFYFLHGHTPEDILHVIYEGIPEKGMPPWGSMYNDEEMIAITSYTVALIGTEPENPKSPEGEFVEFDH